MTSRTIARDGTRHQREPGPRQDQSGRCSRPSGASLVPYGRSVRPASTRQVARRPSQDLPRCGLITTATRCSGATSTWGGRFGDPARGGGAQGQTGANGGLSLPDGFRGARRAELPAVCPVQRPVAVPPDQPPLRTDLSDRHHQPGVW